MEYRFMKQRLIDYKNITEKNYKLIYFYLNNVFKDDSNKNEGDKTSINEKIYKRINGEFSEYEIEGGKAIAYIIRYLKNSEISGQNVLGYSQMIDTNDFSSQRISVALAYLIKAELLNKTINNKKSYYSRTNDFDEKLEKLCDKINVYINAYNLMPYSDDDLFSDDEIEEEIEQKIISLNKKFNIPDKEYDSSEIVSDKEKIIEYMKNIVEAESDIYSLKKRYISLKSMKSHYIELYLIKDSYTICLDYFDKIKNIEDEVSINSNIGTEPSLDYFTSINTINKPIFKGQKPVEPVLKKAGLFNKKKIEQENNEIMLDYNAKLERYRRDEEEYRISLQQYEIDNEKMMIKAKEQYQIAMEQYNERINQIKIQNEKREKQKQSMIENSEKEIRNLLIENKYYQKVKAIEYEMDYIEKCLEEPIKLKQEMYSYNIIYGKYRNFIAISSFIDYFMAGRCDCLSGNDGAYNLYEQETRTDIIINKIDIIIKKLDQIAENQYYVYNKINEINNTLSNISGQLMVNNILQTIQISELERVIDKADEIAYNTKVTAYYAEKTSKYAKIITYLNFLNLKV